MAGTPDPPHGGDARAGDLARPADAEAALSAAEAAHLAARDTEPIDVRGGRLADRETVRLPRQRRPAGPRRPPLALAAAVATGWAAVVSAAPVVAALALAQLIEGGGSAAAAVRLGLAGWLLGHGVPIDTGDGRLALAPLALAALAAWRLGRAGVHTTRGVRARSTGSPRRAFAVAAAIGTAYGLLGALAAGLAGTGDGPQVSAVRAFATLAVFGAVAGAFGAAQATGALDTVARATPPVLRDGLRAGTVAALLLVAAGGAAAGVSLALGGGEAGEVFAAYRTGVAGQAGLTLICLAYAPNAAVWAAAYLAGPGFAVGDGTIVRITDVTVGGLPAVPLFAGLPAGPIGGLGAAFMGVPVFAGMLAGWLLARRRSRRAGDRRQAVAWPGLLGAAAIAGPVAGLLLGVAAYVSAGSLGGGRLAGIGPVPWQVAAAGATAIAIGSLIGATAGRSGARDRDGGRA